MAYIGTRLVVSATELYDQAAAHLENQLGIVLTPGSPMAVWLESISFMAALTAELATDQTEESFKHFGTDVHQVAFVEAAAASADVVVTTIDDAGYTIPAGTTVVLNSPAGGVAFQFDTDVIVAAGDTTEAGVISALLPGSAGNGLDNPVTGPDLDYVASVVLDDPTSGGEDEEDDDAYRDRLSDRLRLLTDTPILAVDFAILARDVPGVHRATGVDNLDPADDSTDNEKMVTVAVVDEDGQALASDVKDAVEELLESRRESNFIVHVVDPDYSSIDVTFTAVALPGYTASAVEEAAEEAVTAYLQPFAWGTPVGDESTGWTNRTVVRYGEVWSLIDQVDGIDYLTALTVEGGTANVTLSGPITLTEPGTVAGTVTAP